MVIWVIIAIIWYIIYFTSVRLKIKISHIADIIMVWRSTIRGEYNDLTMTTIFLQISYRRIFAQLSTWTNDDQLREVAY